MDSQTVATNGLVDNRNHWHERLRSSQPGEIVTVRDVKQAEPK